MYRAKSTQPLSPSVHAALLQHFITMHDASTKLGALMPLDLRGPGSKSALANSCSHQFGAIRLSIAYPMMITRRRVDRRVQQQTGFRGPLWTHVHNDCDLRLLLPKIRTFVNYHPLHHNFASYTQLLVLNLGTVPVGVRPETISDGIVHYSQPAYVASCYVIF